MPIILNSDTVLFLLYDHEHVTSASAYGLEHRSLPEVFKVSKRPLVI